MTATPWRVLAPCLAADWLASDSAAVDRARQLADHAVDCGQVEELVCALLDCVGVALHGQPPTIERARRRLEARAAAAADVSLDAAISAGNWPHREGLR